MLHGKGDARWVWRCHIDTSEPNADTWAFLRPYLAEFDAAVFTMPEFVPPDMPVERIETIAPAIDPLSPKNLDLDLDTARQILDWIGVELPGRLVTQVSRFDAWKDPLGVIAAYRLVREEIPELQLALVGALPAAPSADGGAQTSVHTRSCIPSPPAVDVIRHVRLEVVSSGANWPCGQNAGQCP